MTLFKGDAGVTVLVVEDEPLIRMSAVDIVESAGFTAIEAANAEEAVAIISCETVRIVFTDIDMPGQMNGLQLVAWLDETWPAIDIIVASGRHAMCDEELPAGGRFFSKPYDEKTITAAIHSMTQP